METTKNEFSAPMLEVYKRRDRPTSQFGQPGFYSKETMTAMNELFAEIKKLTPTRSSDIWELYFTVNRGPFEDYADYDELHELGEVDSREEFEEMWKLDFPTEKLWYEFSFCEDAQNGYRAIGIDHKIILDTMPNTPPSPRPLDETTLVRWFIKKVKECIKSVETGEYNRKVSQELPPYLRFGTITGKAFGEVFPEEEKKYLADLSDADTKEFLELMASYDEKAKPSNLLKEMTAGIFFRGCKLGYAANAYESSDSLSPKELYLKHADGRDEGLTEIDEDSPDAFRKWYHHRNRMGHPWEVCRGGNSTHVSLFVSESEDGGYYFTVEGSSWSRAMETIKFYLALYRAGLPVVIYEGKALASRLIGEEKIGIVPRGIFPRYCESYFPGEKILDFMNLPDEKQDEFAKKCVWQKLPEVRLAGK